MKQLKIPLIILISALTFIGLTAAFVCGVFRADGDRTSFETGYGDSFTLSFDSFNCKSLLEDDNSRFYVVISRKVTPGDLKARRDTEGNVIYSIDDITFSDTGSGFEMIGADNKYSQRH